jgi:hypothetical protein
MLDTVTPQAHRVGLAARARAGEPEVRSMVAMPTSETPFGGVRDVTRLRVRAGDEDRHATVLQLERALTEGRLTFDECSDRIAAAFATRFQDELPPLTADLPPAAPPAPGAPGWANLGQMALTQARYSLGNVLRGLFLRAQLVRRRASARMRRGGPPGGIRRRPVLRAVTIGLLVLGGTVLVLLLLALAGMAAHDLLHLGHGHAGGSHHGGWHHHGYDGPYHDGYDGRGG